MPLTRSLKVLIAIGFAATATLAGPQAPANLAAAAVSSSQINLAWLDQSTNEDGFRIDRATSTAGPWAQVGSLGPNTISFSSTGLSGSTTYYFRVYATSASAGNSASSNVAGALTYSVPASGPASPSNLSARVMSLSQVYLSWTDNSSNETGFKVDRATSASGPWTQIATPGSNVNYIYVSGLSQSTTYWFRIRATNGSGDSANAAAVSAAMPTPPTPPTHPVATSVSSSQINLTWTDTSGNEAGFLIERLSGAYWEEVGSTPPNYTSFSVTGLTASTSYTFQISAVTGSGEPFAAPVVTATTLASAPSLPAAPSALTATVVSSAQINLAWVDNSANETGFTLERATSSAGPYTTIATTGANARAFSSTGLAGSTTYYFRVRAFNTSGSSAYAPSVSATTQTAMSIPAAPSGLTATAATSSLANLAWMDNSTNEQGFSVERATTSSGPWSAVGTTALSSYTDTGLAASTTYYYRVRAYNTAGNSPYSNTPVVTMPGGGGTDTTKPTMPTGVLMTSPSCGGIRITWAPSTDLGGAGLKGYKVYRKGVYVGQVMAPQTSFVDSGLPSSTYFYYTVSAIDNASPLNNESTPTPAAGTYTLSCAGSGGDLQWSKNAGGNIYPDEGLAAASDGSGNTYVTGDFSSSTNFGAGSLTSSGSRDAFVAKYRSDGTVAWSKRFGGPYDDFGEGIAVDASGNVYVTGRFQGSIDLGTSLTSGGGYDIFIAKLSGSTGQVVWSKRVGSTGADEGTSVALDASGSVYVTGQFFGTVDFGGGPVTNNSPYVQIFVAKYSGADGAHVWSKRLGKLVATSPTTVGSGRGISVDSSGNAVVTGYFGGPVDFGGGILTSAGGMDVFVAKFAGSDGHWMWAKRFGDASDQHGTSIATDNSNNIVLTGDFLGSIDFGRGALPASPGTQTIFLAKLGSSDGSCQFANSFVATGLNVGSYGWGVATDGADNIVLTGQMSGPVNLGGGPLNNVGGVFAAKYGPTGVHQWSKNFRGGGGQGRGVAIDNNDRIVITGSFDSMQDFGGGDLRSGGDTGTDLFVLSLLP